MPVYARQEPLSTTRELVLTASQIRRAGATVPIQVAVKNNDAAIIIYVGDVTVADTGANGFAIAPGATFSYEVRSPDELVYVVAASGTPSASIIAIGNIAEAP
jgi:hypothetical protein